MIHKIGKKLLASVQRLGVIVQDPLFYGAKCFLIASAVIITINDNVAYVGTVKGPSMQPVFNEDTERSHVFVYRPSGVPLLMGPIETKIRRGDVVTLTSPLDHRESQVKRVIGLPGDIVRTIYAKQRYVSVPPGKCFVEGDNFRRSEDSNRYGCVPMGLITGVVKAVVYPSMHRCSREMPAHRELVPIEGSPNNFKIRFKYRIGPDKGTLL